MDAMAPAPVLEIDARRQNAAPPSLLDLVLIELEQDMMQGDTAETALEADMVAYVAELVDRSHRLRAPPPSATATAECRKEAPNGWHCIQRQRIL